MKKKSIVKQMNEEKKVKEHLSEEKTTTSHKREAIKAKDLYYDTRKCFLSIGKLWKKIQAEGIKISYNDLKKIMEQQETDQINKQVKKPT